jgi:hypothetical protein
VRGDVPMVSTDDAERNTSLRGCTRATPTLWWALVLHRQGRCQQVKQVTVTDTDVRVIMAQTFGPLRFGSVHVPDGAFLGASSVGS